MQPIGPYVPVLQAGNLFFISGQIGIEPDSGQLVDGIAAQTQQTMVNLATVLAENNLAIENLAKCTIYLTDMADFETVNEIYGENLKGHKPARATVAVAGLPKGALIEIEAIAYKQ